MLEADHAGPLLTWHQPTCEGGVPDAEAVRPPIRLHPQGGEELYEEQAQGVAQAGLVTQERTDHHTVAPVRHARDEDLEGEGCAVHTGQLPASSDERRDGFQGEDDLAGQQARPDPLRLEREVPI